MEGELASGAQRGVTLDVPAQVYKLVYLCVFVCALIYMVGAGRFSYLFLFEDGKDPRACFVSVFSCNCSRSPRVSCLE